MKGVPTNEGAKWGDELLRNVSINDLE